MVTRPYSKYRVRCDTGCDLRRPARTLLLNLLVVGGAILNLAQPYPRPLVLIVVLVVGSVHGVSLSKEVHVDL